MDRRTLLGTVSSAAIVALTGCLSDDDGATPSGTETGTDTGTPTPTQTPAPTMTGFDFEVLGSQSGTETDNATVSVDGSDIVVEGTIWGRNGCQTAELPSVNYNADKLTVPVETTERDDAGEMCSSAIVEIDYRATISFENGPPSTVAVTHDRGSGPEPVTTTSP